MNATAEAFRCQALAKEIAAELRKASGSQSRGTLGGGPRVRARAVVLARSVSRYFLLS